MQFERSRDCRFRASMWSSETGRFASSLEQMAARPGVERQGSVRGRTGGSRRDLSYLHSSDVLLAPSVTAK